MKDMDEKKTDQQEEEQTGQQAPEADTDPAREEASQEEAPGEEADKDPEDEADTQDAAHPQEDDKDKKQKKTDPKDAQIADLKDRLVRQMAEFDNYRKRTEKEKAANYDIGASDFIQKILPVVDNFERGLDAVAEEEKDSSFVKGVEMIYRQLLKALEDEGVTEIEAQGKEFDPMFHNAVMQQPSDEYESGTVIQVFQKGYMYKDRVLRHSMVIVAQ